MINIERNKDITSLTTFGIPVKAAYYCEYSSLRELEKIVTMPEYQDNEVLHIGGGSNLLFIEDYQGLILHSKIKGIKGYDKDEENHYVIAGAGEKWTDFVDWCVESGYSGVENMAGIPGEVGASPVQNVGAYGREASDVIFAVECYDILEHKTVRFSNEECKFGYRDSIFKNEGKGRYFVLRVSFKLEKSNVAKCLDYAPLKEYADSLGRALTAKEVRDKVLEIRDSKLPNPSIVGSAGSFFKNPVINKYYYEQEVLRRCPNVPSYPVDSHRVKVSAAWLIDSAGMKGKRLGGARVWPGQCLVIANEGGALASDVMALASDIQNRVSEDFGIDLKPEVNIIDSSIRVTVLGSGTSKGVPEVGCRCRVCRSTDLRDKRLRASVFVQAEGSNLLIDVSPDFREQAMRYGIEDIDAVLITHSHYDHVGGIDDLRPFCTNGDIDLYMQADVEDDLRRRLDYCFRDVLYPGVPGLKIHQVEYNRPFYIRGIEVIPVRVYHGKLPMLGYRIGKFAYITDAKTIEEEELEKLEGVEVLIINALREREHFAHFNISEALAVIEKIKPRQAWLTHMNHECGPYAEVEQKLPANVHFAYDGLKIKI